MQENISPSTIRKVAGEMRKLMETPIDGVKIIPNESDITDIQAIIEGPGTSYLSARSRNSPPNRFIFS